MERKAGQETMWPVAQNEVGKCIEDVVGNLVLSQADAASMLPAI
jgi:hypothetical protein